MSDISDFGLKEAFEVYSKHRDVIVQMWSFYSTGTLAVLGYTIGSEKATHRWPEVFAILVGYIAFSVGNAWAVITSQHELKLMADGIKELLKNKPLETYYAVSPIEPGKFFAFYVVVTSVVCAAILTKYASKVVRARKDSGTQVLLGPWLSTAIVARRN